mgnify:CR=1 FL=1
MARSRVCESLLPPSSRMDTFVDSENVQTSTLRWRQGDEGEVQQRSPSQRLVRVPTPAGTSPQESCVTAPWFRPLVLPLTFIAFGTGLGRADPVIDPECQCRPIEWSWHIRVQRTNKGHRSGVGKNDRSGQGARSRGHCTEQPLSSRHGTVV